MSFPLKAVAVVAAISLGALASQILPGGADDKTPQTAVRLVNRADEQPAQSPPEGLAPAERRPADLPLRHAILRDEKEDDSAEARILKTLAKPTTVEFVDLPLEDCLTFLKDYHQIPVWLNKGAMTEDGIALDQPITLKLAGVSFESVLHLILEPLDMDWVIQDEVLKITTQSWAAGHPETRTYDVHNLLAAGHTPEELIASITKCIEPGSWTGKGTTAGISHTGGVLVVRQSQRVHSDIAHLLEELDEIADRQEDAEAAREPKTAALTIGYARSV